MNMAEILERHVTLEVASVDRVYLNLYVPWLQQQDHRKVRDGSAGCGTDGRAGGYG